MKEKGKTIVFDGVVGKLNARRLEEFVSMARKAAGLHGDISVLITSDSKIRELNSRFRDKDSSTDVLSFPAAESNGFAGDIAISHDIAAQNARELGHSVSDEIRILILHGILHLAGYDHENDQGEMEQKERVLRKKLGLPASLIERSFGSATSSVVSRRSATRSTNAGKSGKRRTITSQRLSRT